MKKSLLLFLLTVISFTVNSQNSYESGYFMDSSGQRINCLIKNIDWKNNPTEFEYKVQMDSEVKKATISTVKEFGIHNSSKYIRHTVDIDRSLGTLGDLNNSRNPIFKKELLFLQVLIESKATLYLYEEGSLQRFFYEDANGSIKQLIHKKYKTDNNFVGENNLFRQQILNELNCQGLSERQIDNLKYSKGQLVNYFIKYNECEDSKVINYETKHKKKLFNLNFRVGLNSTSLAIDNLASGPSGIDRRITAFGNETGLRIGFEAEFIMGFNNSKWSLIVEPTYQYYKTEKQLPELSADLDYTTIEMPVGLRHYIFLTEKSKLFVNASVVLILNSDLSIIYEPNSKDLVNGASNPNLAFGMGYNYNNKYSMEFRINTNRQVLSKSQNWTTDYNVMSVIFGYTLF
ncbi:tRNA modification GTPase [Maribacter sp. HTCC2170]|uniref:tRNA modification GTPase n=1 Tax=Maribacter sp. (strain HTCC2170 / KCCM 42371) TaxID=313603 RepID=UPI00006B49B3|nr:tRNA modification GTPase [Maribacter sp. HTCC2170]EAR01129.1 tRNA modification GTPase [Maribacter sp. HTCC2170]